MDRDMTSQDLQGETHIMRPIAAAALATFAAAAPIAALPASAQGAGGPAPMMQAFQGTMLQVAAQGEATAKPDMATINVGVTTDAATAEAAMSQNASKMNNVIAALRRTGIAEKDIQTSNISLNPQYQYNQNEAPKLIGYQAQNTVTVKVRNLSNVGKAIDAVVKQGSNQINGVSFGIDNEEPAMDRARKDALNKARARAELYANAVGMKVARIAAISESGAWSPPIPMPMYRAEAMQSAAPPIAPGEMNLNVTVNVTYELR